MFARRNRRSNSTKIGSTAVLLNFSTIKLKCVNLLDPELASKFICFDPSFLLHSCEFPSLCSFIFPPRSPVKSHIPSSVSSSSDVMAVSVVQMYPLPDGKTGQQTIETLTKRIMNLTATQSAPFVVDYTSQVTSNKTLCFKNKRRIKTNQLVSFPLPCSPSSSKARRPWPTCLTF